MKYSPRTLEINIKLQTTLGQREFVSLEETEKWKNVLAKSIKNIKEWGDPKAQNTLQNEDNEKMGVDYWQMARDNRNATKVMTLYPEIKETQTLTKASSTSG